jgi:hypothetical protein
MKKRFLRISILASLLVLLICTIGYNQKALQLTNTSSGRKLLLKEGHRVSYVFQGESKKVGVIKEITESSVIISGTTYQISDFKSIGRKRKGSGFLSYAFSFLGTGIVIGAIQNANYDPCPSCTDAGSSGGEYTVIEVGIGLAVLGLGVNTAIRNSPKDVVTKWKIEIIDLSVATSK